jgi:hypothetical protein
MAIAKNYAKETARRTEAQIHREMNEEIMRAGEAATELAPDSGDSLELTNVDELDAWVRGAIGAMSPAGTTPEKAMIALARRWLGADGIPDEELDVCATEAESAGCNGVAEMLRRMMASR